MKSFQFTNDRSSALALRRTDSPLSWAPSLGFRAAPTLILFSTILFGLGSAASTAAASTAGIGTAGAATPGASAAVASPVGGGAEEWPTFLGPRREARSTEKLSLPWPKEGPPVLWTAPLHETYSSPTVAGGGVFVFDRVDDRARLSRLDPASGKSVWSAEYPTSYVDQFDFGGGPRAAPVFDHGQGSAAGAAGRDRVYVFGVDGRLRCHDAADGRVLWDVDTAKQFGVVQNFFGVASTPLVYENLLLVSVGGSPPGKWDNHEGRVEPNGTGLVAFDKLTGEVRYRTLDDLAAYSSPLIAGLGGRDVLLTFARSGLWALEPKTGKVLASFPWRAKRVYSVNASTPVVVGDEIFISESYEKGGVLLRWREDERGARFEVVWSDPLSQRQQSLATHWNTPVQDGGFLYGSHGEKSGPAELRCVEWRTGTVRWKHRGLRRSNSLFADGHLIVLGEYGELVLVRATPEEYLEVQRVELKEDRGGSSVPLLKHPSWNPPVLSNGVLYVAGADRLVALRVGPTVDAKAASVGQLPRQ